MSKTLAQLTQRVRNLVREATPKFHSAVQVTEALNTVLTDLWDEVARISQAEYCLGSNVQNIVAGQGTYNLPTGFVSFKVVQILTDPPDTWAPLDIITPARWGEGDDNTLPSISLASFPAKAILTASTVILRPTPANAIAGGLRIWGESEKCMALVNVGDTSGLPAICDAVLEEGAAADLLGQEGADAAQAAGRMDAQYSARRGSVITRLRNRHNGSRSMPILDGYWEP